MRAFALVILAAAGLACSSSLTAPEIRRGTYALETIHANPVPAPWGPWPGLATTGELVITGDSCRWWLAYEIRKQDFVLARDTSRGAGAVLELLTPAGPGRVTLHASWGESTWRQ